MRALDLSLQACSMWMLGSLWSQVQQDPVGLPEFCSRVHTPVQAKDSDDDDDVTVTVDRDGFMDEFFEQVGTSTPHILEYSGRPWWGAHVSPPPHPKPGPASAQGPRASSWISS